MSIKDYIKETKKKEIGFYINEEKSINEYIRKLKHFLKIFLTIIFFCSIY